MALRPVQGEVPDRVAVRDEDIHVWERAADRPPQGGPGPDLAAEDGGADGGAEGDVSQ